MARQLLLAAVLVALVASGALPAAAQDGAISLSGRVVDAATGEPVAGAEVTVAGASVEGVLTAADGTWRVSGLSHGPQRVRARHLGYQDSEIVVDDPARAGSVRIGLTGAAIALDAVVVTASRRPQRLADVPIATEVVARRELEATGATDVAAAVTERTGIQLTGGHPSGAGIMLQGMDSERVQILLDGQPVSGRLSGTLDLSRIPTSVVERIEIVKGPQSTLYGSEAMGGVVNVITRALPGSGWGGGGTISTGTLGRRSGSVELRRGGEAVSALAQGGYRSMDLLPGQADPNGAGVRRWDGLLKARWAPSALARLDASVLFIEEDQGWRSGQLRHFTDNRQVDARVGLDWSAGPHRFVPTFHLSRFEHLARQGTGERPPAPATGSRQLQQVAEVELLYHWTTPGWTVDAGAELTRDLLEAESVAGQRRDLSSVEPFVQLEVDLGALTLLPGVRHSWSSDWGSHWTPRLAASARPTPTLALRASVARGFRAPGFKELYQQFLNIGPGFAYTVRGSPDLDPETSTNLAASIEWSPGPGYLRGQFFHNRFRDFIETRAVGDSSGVQLFTYGNVEDGHTVGCELEGALALGGARMEAGYAYLRARGGDGMPLLGRPRDSGRLNVTAPIVAGVRGSLTATFTGTTPMALEGGVVSYRDGFPRVDLRTVRSFDHGVDLSVGVDNVLDELPEAWPGFTGRRLYTSLTVSLGAGS